MKNLIISPIFPSLFGMLVGFMFSNWMFGKPLTDGFENMYYAFFGIALYLFNFWNMNRNKTITVSE